MRGLWLWLMLLMMVLMEYVEGSVPCVGTAKGSCRCRTDSGDELDLNAGLNHPITEAISFNSTPFPLKQYRFHPCTNTKLGEGECNLTTLCLKTFQNATSSSEHSIGAAEQMEFVSGTDGGIAISYKNQKAINSLINLICVKSSTSQLTLVNSDEPANLIFNYYSPHACLIPTASRHSLGTTLLIIFFVMVATYLLAGICVKHFLMGARGIEIIPNLNFWKDLPALVTDGIAFIRNGFKPPAQTTSSAPNPNPNPNSYDSI